MQLLTASGDETKEPGQKDVGRRYPGILIFHWLIIMANAECV